MDPGPGTYRKQPEGKVQGDVVEKTERILMSDRAAFTLFLEPIHDCFCGLAA